MMRKIQNILLYDVNSARKCTRTLVTGYDISKPHIQKNNLLSVTTQTARRKYEKSEQVRD